MSDSATQWQELQSEVTRLRRQVAELEARPRAPDQPLAEQWRACLRMKDVGVAVSRPDKSWVEFNDELCDMLGYSRQELMQITWPQLTYPEDLAYDLGRYNQMLAGEIDGYSLRKRYLHKEGRMVYVRLSLQCIRRYDGQIESIVGLYQDVTDRYHAEQQLKENEERYRLLVESAPDMIAVFDADDIVYINAAGAALLGARHPQQLIGQPPERYLPSVDIQRMTREIRKELDAGRPTPLADEQFLRMDGSAVDVETLYLPLSYRGQQVVQVIARDITERKKTQAQLHRAHLELRSHIDNSPLGLMQWDSKFNIIRWSPQAERIFGYRADEIIGRNWAEFDFVHPDDMQSVSQIAQRLVTGVETRNTYVNRNYCKDGREIICEWYNSALYDERGNLLSILSQFNDITERKQAEQSIQNREDAIRGILRAAPVGIGVVSNRVVEEVNDQLCEMVGHSREELLGQNARIFYPDDAEYERVGRDKYAAIRKSAYGTIETRWQRKDGRILDIQLSSAATDIEHPTQHVIFTALDITEQKKNIHELARYQNHLQDLVDARTRELEESREQLRHSERLASIGTLATGLAHEINNPVGGILLAAQNVMELKQNPAAAELVDRCLNDIIDNAQRCGKIIQSILQFARSGESPKKPCDLNEILTRCVQLTGQYLKKRQTSVEMELANQLPPARVNTVEMEQVFVNLLRNAAESAKQGVRIRILSTHEEHTIKIAIEDNGRGIAQEQLSRLFDPFYTTRRQHGGTGLGLSIVHGIIRDHSGSIEVQSEVGRGTVFHITLPCLTEMEGTAHG